MKTRLLVSWCALLFAGIVVTGCGFFNNTPGSTTPGTTGFVYVLNSGGASGVGSVSGYAANPTTGVLSSLVFSPFVVASQVSTPNSMSGDAFGRYLYVSSNVGGGGINGFLISQNTNPGQLSSVGVTATKAAVVALVVDPGGGAVYAVEAGPQVEGFSIASGTGALTAQANSPYSLGSGTPTSIAIAPSGGFLFVGMNNGFIVTVPINSDGTLNITNIVRTAPLAGIINVAALTVDPTVRFLYAVDGAQFISLFLINATTGALTPVSPTVSAGAGPVSVGVAAVTGVPTFLYTANDGGTLGAFIISSSGTLSLVSGSPFSSSVTPLALAVDPSGAFLYVVGSGGSNTVLSFVIVGGVLQAPSTTNPPTGTSPTSVVAVP